MVLLVEEMTFMVMEQVDDMFDESEVKPGRKRWRPANADHLRDWFCSKPFDQALAAYYPKETIETYRITSADAAMRFTRNRLKASGYRGWYVIVVHDKRGSTLWHPHLLLDGRNDQFNKVRRALYKFADVNYKTSGRIDDLKQCAGYMAMRAYEFGTNNETWEFEFMGEPWKYRARGSRGRGRGKGPAEAVTI